LGGELTLDGAIVFIGFMGAGKTTAAAQVAASFGRRAALDSDRTIEERLGHAIAEEFEQRGEQSFRALEEQVVCELLEGAEAGDVVSLGGGSVMSARVRDALRQHTVVLLDVGVDRAWERASSERRPLARDREAFGRLYAEREALYAQLADAIVPGSDGDLEPRALEAIARLRQAPSGTRLLWAVAQSGSYPVLVGAKLLGADVWPIERNRSRRFCVTDENVGALYMGRLGALDGTVTIPAGEESKTLACAERIWRELARQSMARDDHLVALGGGVVGDLAGFCAATYQRGVPIVQVPTTLVAQIDSAYGGKTGVDLPEAKNYVGAYHQPAGVLVDTETLATLPPGELAAGYAELVKTALIAGGELWRRVAADAPLDDSTIVACIRLKLAVVAEDERDAGRRQVLNLGHTIGHAIEAATGYGRYRHGEAVALGLLAALSFSGRGALRTEVAELLAGHGLPTRLEGVAPDSVIEAAALDKKRSGGAVRFVTVEAPGEVRTGVQLEHADVAAAVRELCS
jgi:shikimate kinase/3-dehydroquinate synthase